MAGEAQKYLECSENRIIKERHNITRSDRLKNEWMLHECRLNTNKRDQYEIKILKSFNCLDRMNVN